MNQVLSWIALGLSALAWVGTSAAETLRGRVVHIRDGNTVEILDNAKRTIPIRLGWIDAPEHA